MHEFGCGVGTQLSPDCRWSYIPSRWSITHYQQMRYSLTYKISPILRGSLYSVSRARVRGGVGLAQFGLSAL